MSSFLGSGLVRNSSFLILVLKLKDWLARMPLPISFDRHSKDSALLIPLFLTILDYLCIRYVII
jgi:hypothetical protein